MNEDMTRIAKYVTDPEVKKMLLEKDKDKKGENGSIGTSATRSTIIDSLITKKAMLPKTENGLFQRSLDVNCTAYCPMKSRKLI